MTVLLTAACCVEVRADENKNQEGGLTNVVGYPVDVAGVAIEARFIELPRVEANKLLKDIKYVVKEDSLKQLDALISEKKAIILAQPRLITESGNQALLRTIREYVYADAYFCLNIDKDASGTNRVSFTGIEPARGESPRIEVKGNTYDINESLAHKVFPMYSKTRELGCSLNVAPLVALDDTIHMTFMPEISFESKMGPSKQDVQTPGGKWNATFPDFYSWNLATSITLKSGTTILAAVLEPVRDGQYTASANVVFVLLSADVIHFADIAIPGCLGEKKR